MDYIDRLKRAAIPLGTIDDGERRIGQMIARLVEPIDC
jgi:hypothetical protein